MTDDQQNEELMAAFARATPEQQQRAFTLLLNRLANILERRLEEQEQERIDATFHEIMRGVEV